MTDLRFAFRSLARSPGSSTVAVLTLALGIAATATMFGVIKSLVLDPLPYPDSDRLAQVWMKRSDALIDYLSLTTPHFFDLAESVTSFDAFGVFSPRRFNLGGERPEAVEGAESTPGLFRALRVAPLHGRWFDESDTATDDAPAVILSHGLWQQRFSADPACIGQTVRIDGRGHTIVGVMPADFELLTAWTRNRPMRLWTVLPLRREVSNRGSHWLASIARLKPTVSMGEAGAELRAVADRLRQSSPDTLARRTFWLMPLTREIGGIPALRVSVLLGAGWTLLVLAAQNVSGVMLARGLNRHSEMAVRAALGASRWQIIRLVLTENLLLSATAAALGFLLAIWCLDALGGLLPVEVMPRSGLSIDAWVVGCIFVLTLVTTQMVGLTPALLASRADVLTGLKEGGSSQSIPRKTHRKLRNLVVAQIALALFLTSLALQLSHSYRSMLASSSSTASEAIITAGLSIKGAGYADDETRAAFWERLRESVAILPGVHEAAVASKVPFDGGVGLGVLIDDEEYNPGESRPFTEVSYVSPHFFAAIGAVLQQGRHLERDDFTARWRHRAVVINRAMAERYWPEQNPIGRHLRPAAEKPLWSAEVVGVINDLRQVAERPARPEMYFLHAEAPASDAHLVLRMTAGVPVPFDAVRETLRRIDPDLALAEPKSMQARLTESSRVFSVVMSLVDAFTLGTLGLAALGLYGTLSFAAARRQREMGVRLALGASSRHIILLVLRQACGWVIAGVSLGIAGTWLLGRAIEHTFAGANPFHAPHIALGVVVVLAVALLAAWLPARRTLQVNPVRALRAE